MPPFGLGVGFGGRNRFSRATDLPGCRLWLRQDVVVQSAGISQWTDQSGNGNHATQSSGAAKPVYSGTINGLTCPNFSALTYLDIPYAANLNTAAFTCFLVCEVTGNAGVYRSPLSNRQPGTNGWLFYASNANQWEHWQYSGSGVNILGSPAVTNSNVVVLIGTSDGTTGSLYKGETGLGATSLVQSASIAYQANTAQPMRIGGGSNESSMTFGFMGPIAEVIYYDSCLSAVNRGMVNNYLRTRYNF